MTVLDKVAEIKYVIIDMIALMPKHQRRLYIDECRKGYEITLARLMEDCGYLYHHTAIHPGGIRKRNPVSAEVHSYDGRFGIGYTVHRYKEGSDNSHYVDYWIKED